MASRSSLVAGLDIGGTKILGIAFDPADLSGRVQVRAPTPEGSPAVLEAAVQVVEQLSRASAGSGEIAALGIGVAGLVDRSGTLRYGPNLPGLAAEPVRERIEQMTGLPTVTENDATAATWGEHKAGAGAGVADLVLVTLGTGIGAGLVVGGELVVGRSGFAGEAGHMIVDPDGPACPCGQRGCWERYASGSGLARLARDAATAGRLPAVVAASDGDPEAVRGVDVTRAAAAGDGAAAEVVRQFAWWVALGLVNLTNLLDPELLLIAGGLVEMGDLLLEPVRDIYGELLYASDQRPLARIDAAALGEEAGAIGAGLLAVDLVKAAGEGSR